jgi:hypothetical protein
VIERIPKGVLLGGVILAPAFLALLAYAQPGYFTSLNYLGGLLILELICAALWMYRQVFFPLILIAFLFAGTGLAVGVDGLLHDGYFLASAPPVVA